jgi:Mn2+/Fe2+ NRAMP family transporter
MVRFGADIPGVLVAIFQNKALIGSIGEKLRRTPPSAVVNGVVAVPIMIVTMLMAANPRIMGQHTIGPILKALGWLSTLAMALAAAGMIALNI